MAIWANMLSVGSNDEKAKSLYHIFQTGSGGADRITAEDKEFIAGLPMLINTVVRMPMEACGDKSHPNIDWNEKGKALIKFTNDIIYDVESSLERGFWEEKVTNECPWLL